MDAIVTVEDDPDHWEQFRLIEADYDRPDGPPIIDAADYVFDSMFPGLDESQREEFHFKCSVRFEHSELTVDEVHPAVAAPVARSRS